MENVQVSKWKSVQVEKGCFEKKYLKRPYFFTLNDQGHIYDIPLCTLLMTKHLSLKFHFNDVFVCTLCTQIKCSGRSGRNI